MCKLGLPIYVVGCSLDNIILIFALGLISLLRITELYSTKNCRECCVSLFTEELWTREKRVPDLVKETALKPCQNPDLSLRTLGTWAGAQLV